MIYHLLYPLSDQVSMLNVFRYITFRSVYAMLTALILSIMIGPAFIEWLRKLRFGQYIKDCGPDHQSKSGTPTMGGLMIGFCMLLSVFLWGDLTNKFVWLTILVFLGFGAVGFADDYLKVVRRHNDGLTARSKLLGQLIISLGVMSLLVSLRTCLLICPGYTCLSACSSWSALPTP
jgi:phospho-N-acetylmuramoyl-pentapeptide-transferase